MFHVASSLQFAIQLKCFLFHIVTQFECSKGASWIYTAYIEYIESTTFLFSGHPETSHCIDSWTIPEGKFLAGYFILLGRVLPIGRVYDIRWPTWSGTMTMFTCRGNSKLGPNCAWYSVWNNMLQYF